MSVERKKVKEISGWYVKEELTPEERAAKERAINEWWARRTELHYKNVVAEIPAKMNLDLGVEAYKLGKTFPELVEIILSDWMKSKGYDPQKYFGKYEIGCHTGKPFPIEYWVEEKEKIKK
jgi:hypothetical protein